MKTVEINMPAVRAYNRLYAQHAEPLAFWQEIDAGFDGGEFCAERHTRDWEDMEQLVVTAVSKAFGLPARKLLAQVYDVRSTQAYREQGL